MKKKRLISILTLFMCVALVSIGFAAWVVTGDSHNEAIGNVEVSTVEDQRLVITDVNLSAPAIIFGKGTKGTNSWLQATDVKEEVLSTTLTFTIENNEQCTGVDLILAPIEESKTKYEAAETKNYIVSPENATTTLQKVTSGVDGKGIYTCTFTWKWGSEFSLNGTDLGQNPYTFYNSMLGEGYEIADARKANEPKKTNADYAKAALEGLAALQGVKFNISIHAKSTATQA